MGHLERPVLFKMEDLFLDVNLVACANGSEFDALGRKTFNTSFFRKGVGFGITNIEIEINPSLQPLIEITFKDLYGNTMFNNNRGDLEAIDSSVLFDVPSPKFIFSFKGFLGRKVTWLLNLKNATMNFVPSDSSYEIKCSFVPNQWGFMADIPVLYLLACKKLRYEAYGQKSSESFPTSNGETCTFTTDSVFSYVRIGKQVESKYTDETSNFDILNKQLGILKSGELWNSLDSVIKFNEAIKGLVNGVAIQGFTNLKVQTTEEKNIKDKAVDSKNSVQINALLKLNVYKGEDGNPLSETYTAITPHGQNGYKYDDLMVDSNGVVKIREGIGNTTDLTNATTTMTK